LRANAKAGEFPIDAAHPVVAPRAGKARPPTAGTLDGPVGVTGRGIEPNVPRAIERDDAGINRLKGGRHGVGTAAGLRGARRSPATLPSFHEDRAPRNKGLRYPPDPPTVEEIIAVMRAAGVHPDGMRLRGVIVVLWRAGLRISEALALTESDLDRSRGAVLVRRGKGGKRCEVGMDRWAWENLDPGSRPVRAFP